MEDVEMICGTISENVIISEENCATHFKIWPLSLKTKWKLQLENPFTLDRKNP